MRGKLGENSVTELLVFYRQTKIDIFRKKQTCTGLSHLSEHKNPGPQLLDKARKYIESSGIFQKTADRLEKKKPCHPIFGAVS